MRSKLSLLIFLLVTAYGFAQDVTLSGKVTEEATGLPIPGVNVTPDNSNAGIATDIDGTFSITVPQGTTITFTFVGFEPVTKKVTETQNVTIEMKETANVLDELVLIGYGSTTKKDVTGAVGVVSSKTIDKLKPVRMEQALQGTVSGVNVTSQSGSPGSGFNLRIRGVATNGNAAPLVIIDGYVGDMSLLNPSDIETLTVLKDAQAAIYGTQGANGVILVTTKTGRKNQKTQISYDVYTGFQETNRKLPTLNATEYAGLLNESYANGNQDIPYPNLSGLGSGTDWQDEVFEKAPITSHNLAVNGGSEKITYSVSGSSLSQEGIVGRDKSGYDRNTARIALGVDVLDNLHLDTNVMYSDTQRKTLSENALGSVLFNALNVPATLTPYDEQGEYTLVPSNTGFGTEIINPLAQIANTYNQGSFKRINGRISGVYNPVDGLNITARVGFNTGNGKGKTFNKQVSYGGKIYDVTRSSVNQNATDDNNYTFDLFAEYKKVFAETHDFTFTLGTTAYKEWGSGLYGTGYDIPYNSWEFADISLANGLSDAKTTSSYVYDHRRLSYFGRLQYNFKERYLVSAMIRRDQSTRFSPEHRTAYFPSVTAGWNITEEPFWNKDNSIISFAKIRASYGVLGSDFNQGNEIYRSVLSGEATYVFDNALVSGVAIGQIPNPKGVWEEARKFDVGADVNFFNNKLTLVADYFIDTRHDLLIGPIPVTGIVGIGAPGASAPTVNAGSVKNSGLELGLGYDGQLGDGFTYSANYNVTFINNKVTEVNNGTGFVPGGSFGLSELPSRMQEGYSMGYFYGYQMEGIFQTQEEVNNAPSQLGLGTDAHPGDIRFKDVNGDGVITAEDKTKIGSPIPKATMGFNLSLNYKNFDFVAFAYASLGNDMVRAYERNVPNGNRLNYVLNRWTGEGTSNTVPRVTTGATNNALFSSYYVEDASFCRIQNLQLGYTLNPDWFGNVITKARFYVSVNNPFTFTKYMGYDPSASSGAPIGGGVDRGFYPQARMFLIGANIKL